MERSIKKIDHRKKTFRFYDVYFVPGGWTPHMKGVGMLVGNFELNPSRRPIWAWPKLFFTPKRDYVKTQTIYIFLYFFIFSAKYDGVLPRTP